MSILNKIGDNPRGRGLYMLLMLWMGIMVGIPALIWDNKSVNICGGIALCGTFYLTILYQFNIPFVKDYPLTFMHLCYSVIYAIAMAVYLIIGEDPELFASILISLACLFVSFIIDLIYYKK